MGAEERCRLRFGGQVAEGKALLEMEEIMDSPPADSRVVHQAAGEPRISAG